MPSKACHLVRGELTAFPRRESFSAVPSRNSRCTPGGCTAIENRKVCLPGNIIFEKRRDDREIVAIGASVTVPRSSRHRCGLYGLHSMTLANAMQGRIM